MKELMQPNLRSQNLEQKFKDLFYTKETPEKYKDMITKQIDYFLRKMNNPYSKEAMSTSFSELWEQANNKVKKFLKEKLDNQILINLGGSNISLPSRLKSENTMLINNNFDKSLGGGRPIKDSSTIICYHDMLDLAAKIKDESCNFQIDGIDSVITPNDEYNIALTEEVLRATKKDGIIFGINSEIFSYLEKNDKIKKADCSSEIFNIFIKSVD